MRSSGAFGGGLECLFRDVGVLKNLEVSDGDVLAMVIKYDGRMYW